MSYENLKRFLKRLTVGKGYDKLIYDTNNTSEKGKTQGGETVKLRNINRGLVLGGVLALGVVCYSVYDNNQFKTSKPEIEQVVRDYVADLSEANIGSGDALKTKWTDFVNSHYADYTSNYDNGGFNKTDMLEYAQSSYEQTGGEITSAEYDIKDMSINKSGADGSKVTLIYEVCYDISEGDPMFLTPSGLTPFNSGSYTNSSEYEPSKTQYKAVLTYGYVDLFIIKTADGWKIATSNDYGYDEQYRFDDSEQQDDVTADSEPAADSTADTESYEISDSEGADSVE